MNQRRRSPLTILPADPHVCNADVRLQRLGQVPMFASLDGDELRRVGRKFRTYGFDADEVIYPAGAPATRMYVVATGAAKSIRSGADGRETILALYGPGDFLGAVPAFDADTYSDWAWSITPSCLLGLDAADYDAIMEEFPSVMRATLQAVSQHLVEARSVVHFLAGMPLEQRLAATLLLLADKVGRAWEGGILIDLPLTRDDLAALTGVATESVSRVTSRWHRDGLIESGRGWIAVRDADALRSIHRT